MANLLKARDCPQGGDAECAFLDSYIAYWGTLCCEKMELTAIGTAFSAQTITALEATGLPTTIGAQARFCVPDEPSIKDSFRHNNYSKKICVIDFTRIPLWYFVRSHLGGKVRPQPVRRSHDHHRWCCRRCDHTFRCFLLSYILDLHYQFHHKTFKHSL